MYPLLHRDFAMICFVCTIFGDRLYVTHTMRSMLYIQKKIVRQWHRMPTKYFYLLFDFYVALHTNMLLLHWLMIHILILLSSLYIVCMIMCCNHTFYKKGELAGNVEDCFVWPHMTMSWVQPAGRKLDLENQS
jgi:hypothetical protein